VSVPHDDVKRTAFTDRKRTVGTRILFGISGGDRRRTKPINHPKQWLAKPITSAAST
jgi:hypothetical protein